MPTVSYFLSTTADPIDGHHPLWYCPLPDKRSSATEKPGVGSPGSISYSQYFSVVSRFCETDGWAVILKASSRKLQCPIIEADIIRLSIFLVKHGAFYHPARLVVDVADQRLSFVINVAVSDEGRRTLPREIKTLEQLNDRRPFGWLPDVYGSACLELPTGQTLQMFLGDWFDGFHEFHLTDAPRVEEPTIFVWDGARSPLLLSDLQTAALYLNAAMILTTCYDPITSHHIFPWHHAAGDFVVRVEDGQVAVRLITARDYVPLAPSLLETATEKDLLDALVLFFITLTLRMRLDRLDGVGKLVWAPDRCLSPVVDGFFRGLDLTARASGFPDAFPDMFRHYLNRHRLTDLQDRARESTQTIYANQHGEREIISHHLDDHLTELYRLITI
jgi:hypothetical protein